MRLRHPQFIIIVVLLCIASRDAASSEGVHRESILAQSREFEKKMENAGAFLQDTALNAYLNTVLQNVQRDTVGKDFSFRIRVLTSPSFNAFAAPHGSIYICTGLLSQIENEAQLAALVGHEVTHVVNDHVGKNLENTKKKALSSARLQIGLDFFIGALAGAISSVTMKSAVTGYSRDLEREADSLGLIRMRQAGYAPLEFRNLFMILKKRIEQENIKQPYFFSTHPAMAERIENYYELQGRDTLGAAQGVRNEKEYMEMIRPALYVDGIMNKAAGKWATAEKTFLKVLQIHPADYTALTNLGDIARLGTYPQANETAFTWYKKAVKCANEDGEALRKLGFYYFKTGQRNDASQCFKEYMQKHPSSPFIAVVKEYQKQCEK